MDRQDIFDRVKAHALAQNRCALHDDRLSCAYLAYDGAKCFIGALLTNDQLAVCGSIRGELGVVWSELEIAVGAQHSDRGFLINLQTIHDIHPPESWPAELARFADRYELVNTDA